VSDRSGVVVRWPVPEQPANRMPNAVNITNRRTLVTSVDGPICPARERIPIPRPPWHPAYVARLFDGPPRCAVRAFVGQVMGQFGRAACRIMVKADSRGAPTGRNPTDS
jgi:hypothetical protein